MEQPKLFFDNEDKIIGVIVGLCFGIAIGILIILISFNLIWGKPKMNIYIFEQLFLYGVFYLPFALFVGIVFGWFTKKLYLKLTRGSFYLPSLTLGRWIIVNINKKYQ